MITPDPTTTAQQITHINRYRLVSKLGRGATSQVYLALDDQGQSVTIKLVPAAAVSDAARARFDAEAGILASLNHPGLPRLIESGTTEDLPIDIPYLVSQYIHGLSLDEYTASNSLSDEARLRLIAEACLPLQYLHDHAVLHRDIKPSNIIITPDARPVIIDFGFATPIAATTNESPPLRTVGTTRYASPEAVTASDPEGPPTDVYALAVVCYELLTDGHWPYPNADPVFDDRQTIESILPTRLSVLRPDLRGPLDEILACALAKDPQARYPSATAFADDILRYIDRRPVRVPVPGVLRRVAHYWKHARQFLLVIALLAAIATTATLGWIKAHNRSNELRQTLRHISDVLISTRLDTPEGRAGVAKEITSSELDLQLVWVVFEALGQKAREDELFTESLLWYEQARNWIIQNRGPNHQFILRADQLICETLVMAGRSAEAERRLRHAIAQYVDQPEESIEHGVIIRNRILRLYWSLGIALEHQGKLTEAESLLSRIYQLQLTHMHPDHTDKGETRKVLDRVQSKLSAQPR